MKILFLFLFISVVAQGQAIKVLEIDTGVDKSHEFINRHIRESSNENYTDFNGHGTHIAGIILDGVCNQVELISCRYFNDESYLNCFKKALNLNVDVINLSGGGDGFIKDEFILIKQIEKKHIPLIVAAGNERTNFDNPNSNYFPASYRTSNITIVGNIMDDGRLEPDSGYGMFIEYEHGTNVVSALPKGKFGAMTGSSQATARRTNKWLKQKCRIP